MPPVSDLEQSSASESESESASDSDSSSAGSIAHDAGRPSHGQPSAVNGSNYAMDFFVSRISSHDSDHVRSSHVPGRLVDNRSKRKSEHNPDDPFDRGHTSKAPRLTSLSQPAVDLIHDSVHDSDYSDGGEHEESDSESDMDGVQSAALAPQEPALHPSFPRTAFQLLRQSLPYVHAKERDIPFKLRTLIHLPVRQAPILRKTFLDAKPQNVVSFLLQATGELLPLAESCEHCQRGNGIYKGCVVSRDPLINDVIRGACARCWYGRQGSRCSLRFPSENEPRAGQYTPVPVPQLPPMPNPRPVTKPTEARPSSEGRKETPIPPPAYAHPLPAAPRPLSSTAAHASKGFDPATISGLAQKQGPSTASIENRVDSWEKRYERMSMPDLLATHKHLIEWNVDCSTRMSAMTAVLFRKLATLPGPDQARGS